MEYLAHVRKSDGEQQRVGEHLLGVCRRAGVYSAKIGLQSFGEFLGLQHDLGKYSKAFCDYIRSATGILDPDADDYVDAAGLRGKIDHSTAGAQNVVALLAAQGKAGEIAGAMAALCIASHHSGLIDCLAPDGTDSFSRRITKRDQLTHLTEALGNVDAEVRERLQQLANDRDMVRALLRKCDEVRRGKGPIVGDFNLGLLVRFLFSCLTDADGIETADFESPVAAQKRLNGQYTEWSVLATRLDRALDALPTGTRSVDERRSAVSVHCLRRATDPKGIFTLTVPTGGGKTLASLRFALNHAKHYQMDRVIFIVPFTTIIDQNAQVVRLALEPEGADGGAVVLEHHSNLMPARQTWTNKILSQDWDAPVVFTTSVQLLEALFGGGTRSARRMHQLANSVLIFDEVQTLPIRVTHLFCNAMNYLVRHCGSTVILCTATQPLLNRIDPLKGRLEFGESNEIVPNVTQLFAQLKRVEVLDRTKPGGWSNIDVADLAGEEMRRSGSCLAVVNTKRSAQALYVECARRHGNSVHHLSASMCPAHRRKVLDTIKQRLDSEPVVCVSTQVIEAGVDIDFGSVVRFVAGLDSIAQAAGRCNRNGARAQGRVHVVNPAEENLDMLRDIREGRDQTMRILDEFRRAPEVFGRDLLSPAAMGVYFNYYFFRRASEMDYLINHRDDTEIKRDDTLLSLLASNQASLEEFARQSGRSYQGLLRQSFMTAANAFAALDAPTRGVIVQHGDEGKRLVGELAAARDIPKQLDLLRTCQQYSVNVFPHQLKQLEKEGAIHEVQSGTGILYVDQEYYSPEFGLSTSAVEAQAATMV